MDSLRPPRPVLQNSPGHVVRPSKQGWTVRWQARSDLISLGYPVKGIQVWKGRQLTRGDRRRISARCHRYQANMLAWAGVHKPPPQPRDRFWTPEREQLVMTLSTNDAFSALGGKRSKMAIRQRKHRLTHPDEFARVTDANRGPFSHEELQTLRKHYPIVDKLRDLLPLFPRRKLIQIHRKARAIGLKRKYMGDVKLAMNGLFNLVDEIRMKIKDTGMTFQAFDKEIGTGSYFSKDCKLRQKVNFTALGKALMFFGATLTIDWCER